MGKKGPQRKKFTPLPLMPKSLQFSRIEEDMKQQSEINASYLAFAKCSVYFAAFN
jgi:hypothetical protein